MRYLKLLSVFLLFLISTNTGFAQSTAPTDAQKEEMVQNQKAFMDELKLSEDQKIEFEAITMKYMPQMKAVGESDASKFRKYRELKAINKEKNAEMKELLSKDQYEMYLEQQKEMQKKMKEKRG